VLFSKSHQSGLRSRGLAFVPQKMLRNKPNNIWTHVLSFGLFTYLPPSTGKLIPAQGKKLRGEKRPSPCRPPSNTSGERRFATDAAARTPPTFSTRARLSSSQQSPGPQSPAPLPTPPRSARNRNRRRKAPGGYPQETVPDEGLPHRPGSHRLRPATELTGTGRPPRGRKLLSGT